jgi:hypothetical protein
VKTVVREFKWDHKTIDDMFIDDVDYRSIMYWYDDLVEVHKQLKKEK